MNKKKEKSFFQGQIISVQPRICLYRIFDRRSHSFLGFLLFLDGEVDGEPGEFSVGVGKATQAKHSFQCADIIQGKCLPVSNPQKEPADYYQVSQLKRIQEGAMEIHPPPWMGIPEDLDVYQERGYRRLFKETYLQECRTCVWGCNMTVKIILDHWDPRKVKYRKETFCFGPKSCSCYNAGPQRKVPGRGGKVWREPDWVDEDNTSHRELDE